MGNRQRQARKLYELRGMEMRWNDETEDALTLVLGWKSEQYRGAGYVDAFASAELVASFERLRERGKLIVSTLRLDGKIVAGHAGLEHEGRFYYWLPAYDKAFAKDSVGAILLEWMIEHAYQLGVKEFDFLLGSEKYKWAYATHSRLVGPLGKEALSVRTWRPVRARVIKQIRKHSGVYARLQELKRRMLYVRMGMSGY
jgi:CelD/BcsL family acetyltransferase involved in cellulose biosynthesis